MRKRRRTTLDLTSEDGVDVFSISSTAVSSTVSSTESSEVEASSYMLEIVFFRTHDVSMRFFLRTKDKKMQKMNDLLRLRFLIYK